MLFSSRINVALVDDHTLFRKTLKNYITTASNFNVVVHSPNIPDLFNNLKEFKVHVLLMDIYMPLVNGNEAIHVLSSEYPDIKVLVLSMCSDMNLLSEILDSGVYGIVSKTDEPEEIIRAITAAAEQKIYRNKLFTELMYWNKQNDIKNYNSTKVLFNDRECEILKLLWEEKSNKEIADHLFLSVRSVEKIRQDMKEKTGVKSTIGLLKYAIKKRIISIDQYNANGLYRENGFS